LIVCFGSADGGHLNHTVSDNIDGVTGWIRLGSGKADGATWDNDISMWYKKNIPSGITTVTCTDSTGGYVAGIVHEVSGASTTAPFTDGETGVTTGAATTNPQTSAITNATAVSVYFACLGNVDGDNPATMEINGTGSVGTWVHESANSDNLNGHDYVPVCVVNQVVSSSLERRHGWTTDSLEYATVIGVFHN
jgi:hypothetical protein